MAKVKKQANKKAQKQRPRRRGAMDEANKALAAYDRMLADPCAAPPVHAPYLGTGSGYLVRTTENVYLTYSGTALPVGKSTGNFSVYYTPGAPQLHVGTFGNGGSNTVITSPALTAWPITATSTVRRYRPVAACMKWIPYGPYADRSGEIGCGYQVGQSVSTGGSWTSATTMQQSLRRAPNGSVPHEVRWLPASTDADFISNTSGNAQGGTVFIAGIAVDSVNSSVSAGGFNGYIELTTIWEWEPISDNSAAAATIVASPTLPPAFTINDHQSKIRNLAAFVLDGVGAVAQAAGYGTVNNVTTWFSKRLTGGVGRISQPKPSMPALTY